MRSTFWAMPVVSLIGEVKASAFVAEPPAILAILERIRAELAPIHGSPVWMFGILEMNQNAHAAVLFLWASRLDNVPPRVAFEMKVDGSRSASRVSDSSDPGCLLNILADVDAYGIDFQMVIRGNCIVGVPDENVVARTKHGITVMQYRCHSISEIDDCSRPGRVDLPPQVRLRIFVV
jgi:hypothetical protein